MEALDGRPASWDGHLLLVHASEMQRRAGLTAWIRRGLDLGAKILYTEPAQEPADRGFLGVLRSAGTGAEEAVQSGRVQVVTASEDTYDAAFIRRTVDDALAEGYPTVRWAGEIDTAWGVMSPAEHAEVEWTTDELCRTRPVSILCQYPAGMIQATLQSACAMHGAGLRESLLHVTPIPGGVALAGEVDASNERILRCALVAASATGGPRGSCFVVEMSGLRFLDVAGARALVTGTTQHRLGGGTVCLQAPQRGVARVLGLLGVDRADRFSLEGAS